MSKKANPTVIGIFTLIGLIIAAIAVILFGAGKYFQQTHEILVYFQKSAYGLQEGSDVRFGGVRIGRVKSISVLVDTEDNRKVIPVILELGEKELRAIDTSSGMSIDFGDPKNVGRAVEKGLRAGMKQQSLLTGQLYVEFDILPRDPGFVYRPEIDPGYPVVPTVGTEIDELIAGIADGLKKFNAIDLEGIAKDLRATLVSAKDQIAALNVKEINDNVLDITKDIQTLTGNEKLGKAIDSLDASLREINALTAKANAGFDPLLEDLTAVLERADQSLDKINSAADEINAMTNPRAPVLMRFQNVLEETERASRAIKELANDLKRTPNSIISGKENE